jgi:hypothetical protein
MTGGEIGNNGGMGVNISGGTVTKTGGGIVYGIVGAASGADANHGGSIGGATGNYETDRDYPDPGTDPGPGANTAKTWYVSPSGSDANDGWPGSVPVRTVSNALQKVAAYKTAHPTEWNPGDSATIVIMGGAITIDLNTEPPPLTLGGTSENPVIIEGTLTISGGSGSSPEVTLTHVTLNGGGNSAITVSGGNLVIQTGATITGGGKGVVVNSGQVTMTGGKVWDNSGDGVEVHTGGTFAMTGGEIGGNGGKGVNISGGAFTKTGGGTVYGTAADGAGNNANGGGSIADYVFTFGPYLNYPIPEPRPDE